MKDTAADVGFEISDATEASSCKVAAIGDLTAIKCNKGRTL